MKLVIRDFLDGYLRKALKKFDWLCKVVHMYVRIYCGQRKVMFPLTVTLNFAFSIGALSYRYFKSSRCYYYLFQVWFCQKQTGSNNGNVILSFELIIQLKGEYFSRIKNEETTNNMLRKILFILRIPRNFFINPQ